MLDWVIDNYNVSLKDALFDAGQMNEALELKVENQEVSSIGVYLGCMVWWNKSGLIHLSEKYPECITIQDWESIIMIILKHHDYDSLWILNTKGMKAAFNLISVAEGVEKI